MDDQSVQSVDDIRGSPENAEAAQKAAQVAAQKAAQEAAQKAAEYNYLGDFENEDFSTKEKTHLYKHFNDSTPVLKNTDPINIKFAKIHYNFKKKSDSEKIFLPTKDIMKLVCVVRFIWPEDPEEDGVKYINADFNTASYMLMGYRLDTDDKDYIGVNFDDTSTTSSSAEGENISNNGGAPVGAAGGTIKGPNAEQKKRMEKFRKFICSLNNGSLDPSDHTKSNITSTPLANNLEKLEHQKYSDIEKKFEKYLSVNFSSMRSKPFFTYNLYKIDNTIRNANLDILNYNTGDDKLYFYKFSVHYTCAIVNDILYYQKKVDKITLHEEKEGVAPDEANYRHITIPEQVRNDLSTPLKRKEAAERAKLEEGREVVAPAEPDANQGSGKGAGNAIGASGGYKRKLKRKELNTMTLNELKQLHKNNGIKMNSNKTVNALINNYIKNYK
jgi:hypothetical protein